MLVKVKTSELSGAALDWAVAKCEGALHPLGNVVIEGKSLWLAIDGEAHTYMEEDVKYAPSFDWAQGGPIIEREGIMLEQWKTTGYWQAANALVAKVFTAITPLVAAMRCFVASKLGDEVEIPEELCA